MSGEPEALALLEYRVRAVGIGETARRMTRTWVNGTPVMEIYFDGRLRVEGLATGFTNGAIEAAIVHCRALLEFLGVSRAASRIDDVCIEDFNGLTAIGLDTFSKGSRYSPALAKAAVSHLMHVANKGLAHTTSALVLPDNDSELLGIAFELSTRAMNLHFFGALGLPLVDPQPPRSPLRTGSERLLE